MPKLGLESRLRVPCCSRVWCGRRLARAAFASTVPTSENVSSPRHLCSSRGTFLLSDRVQCMRQRSCDMFVCRDVRRCHASDAVGRDLAVPGSNPQAFRNDGHRTIFLVWVASYLLKAWEFSFHQMLH